MTSPPRLRVAVQMERLHRPTEWEEWRFRVAAVDLDDGSLGTEPHPLRDDGRQALVLHPGHEVALHRDEAEGYYLNLSTGTPVWFVMWRTDDDDPSHAAPELVTLSYNEAGRLLDAQERVDTLPLPPAVAASLQDFVDLHYRPEPKQRRRPASFRAPEQR